MSAISLSVAPLTRSRSASTVSLGGAEPARLRRIATNEDFCAPKAGTDKVKVNRKNAIAARTFFMTNSFAGGVKHSRIGTAANHYRRSGTSGFVYVTCVRRSVCPLGYSGELLIFRGQRAEWNLRVARAFDPAK